MNTWGGGKNTPLSVGRPVKGKRRRGVVSCATKSLFFEKILIYCKCSFIYMQIFQEQFSIFFKPCIS